MAIEQNIFTKELTNDTLTLTAAMGIRSISARVTTATGGTVTGTMQLDDIASGAITLTDETAPLTITVEDASVLVGLIFNAPAGCTMQIVASK